jgi:hypothetical protein
VKSQLYEVTTVSGGALAVGTLLAACVAGLIPARHGVRRLSIRRGRCGQNNDIGREQEARSSSIKAFGAEVLAIAREVQFISEHFPART